MTNLAILGASGHGKVVADIASSMGVWNKIFFFDDAWPEKNRIGIWPVVGNTESLLQNNSDYHIFVAIGNNHIRFQKLKLFEEKRAYITTLIHPSAFISNSANVGAGSVVMPGAVVNADASIGKGCIINSNSVIEHDCNLSDAVHISPGSCIAGAVKIGQMSWLGIGSSVIQSVNIGSNVIVGAGSVVISDVPNNCTVVGVPARPIKIT